MLAWGKSTMRAFARATATSGEFEVVRASFVRKLSIVSCDPPRLSKINTTRTRSGNWYVEFFAHSIRQFDHVSASNLAVLDAVSDSHNEATHLICLLTGI